MAQFLSDFINGNFRRDKIASWVLCAIPASTIQKHRLRYSALLKTVSEETGIRNGIDFIRPKYDRKDSRQQKEANTTRNLEFDRQQIHGNWIILIDDVTTRGTSFVQCSNKLYACGAKYVYGFLWGKLWHFKIRQFCHFYFINDKSVLYLQRYDNSTTYHGFCCWQRGWFFEKRALKRTRILWRTIVVHGQDASAACSFRPIRGS